MFLTFDELERRAYINGRTFLAKAYAAAADAEALVLTQADEATALSEFKDSINETVEKLQKELKEATEACEAARESAKDQLQLGLVV